MRGIASLPRPRAECSGDFFARGVEVRGVVIPLRPTASQTFCHFIGNGLLTAVRQQFEIFVIFESFADLFQPHRLYRTGESRVGTGIKQRTFAVELMLSLAVGGRVGPDVAR